MIYFVRTKTRKNHIESETDFSQTQTAMCLRLFCMVAWYIQQQTAIVWIAQIENMREIESERQTVHLTMIFV